MDMLRLIEAKRDGGRHDAAALAWLVQGVVDGSLPEDAEESPGPEASPDLSVEPALQEEEEEP